MSDNKKYSDSTKYATVENVKKCIDNADRLYEDALKTSLPTRAALIELSIEELAKGFLVLYKTPEFENSAIKAEFVDTDKILDDLERTDFIKTIDEFKIGDFTKHFHREKLNFIESLVKMSQQFFAAYKTQMEPLIKVYASNYSQYLSKSIVDPMKILQEALSNLSGSGISDLDKIKEDGFYVDFKDGKVTEPQNISFPIQNLSSVFSFLRLLAQNIMILLGGWNILEYNTTMKDLANKLNEMPPVNSKKDEPDDNKVICLSCKHNNPEKAKFCMECGAKLE
ncbi:hypothetical protein [Ferroplasma sp.]|jgi:hypothetical protein|uniref:hypothetical protein n=1 Tax=Ferroplasma sp. TaxID=2591003 RepID=UPI0026086FD5|nr:hypothetical protein [Ferroplasma sp.]